MPNRQPIRTSSRSPNSSTMPAPSRSRRSRTAQSSSDSGTARSPLPTLLLSNGGRTERRHVREAGEIALLLPLCPDFRNHGNPGIFLSFSAFVEIPFTAPPPSTSLKSSTRFFTAAAFSASYPSMDGFRTRSLRVSSMNPSKIAG